MELRCQRKGSVSYGLGADFSLPHCLVGDEVSESSAEPSPAGISEPRRAEISWYIVMVQRSGKVSRDTAVGCIFLSFWGWQVAWRHHREKSVLFMSLVMSLSNCRRVFIAFKPILHIKHVPFKIWHRKIDLLAGEIATLRCPRSRACFTGNSSANLERFSEKSVRETWNNYGTAGY